MPGRGANERPAFFRQNACNPLGVFSPQGFPGQYDNPGIDVIRVQLRCVVCPVDDLAECSSVDACFALIGGQANGRLEQCCPLDNEVAS